MRYDHSRGLSSGANILVISIVIVLAIGILLWRFNTSSVPTSPSTNQNFFYKNGNYWLAFKNNGTQVLLHPAATCTGNDLSTCQGHFYTQGWYPEYPGTYWAKWSNGSQTAFGYWAKYNCSIVNGSNCIKLLPEQPFNLSALNTTLAKAVNNFTTQTTTTVSYSTVTTAITVTQSQSTLTTTITTEVPNGLYWYGNFWLWWYLWWWSPCCYYFWGYPMFYYGYGGYYGGDTYITNNYGSSGQTASDNSNSQPEDDASLQPTDSTSSEIPSWSVEPTYSSSQDGNPSDPSISSEGDGTGDTSTGDSSPPSDFSDVNSGDNPDQGDSGIPADNGNPGDNSPPPSDNNGGDTPPPDSGGDTPPPDSGGDTPPPDSGGGDSGGGGDSFGGGGGGEDGMIYSGW